MTKKATALMFIEGLKSNGHSIISPSITQTLKSKIETYNMALTSLGAEAGELLKELLKEINLQMGLIIDKRLIGICKGWLNDAFTYTGVKVIDIEIKKPKYSDIKDSIIKDKIFKNGSYIETVDKMIPKSSVELECIINYTGTVNVNELVTAYAHFKKRRSECKDTYTHFPVFDSKFVRSVVISNDDITPPLGLKDEPNDGIWTVHTNYAYEGYKHTEHFTFPKSAHFRIEKPKELTVEEKLKLMMKEKVMEYSKEPSDMAILIEPTPLMSSTKFEDDSEEVQHATR